MEATEILIEEHKVIERVLAAMDAAARRIEAGQPIGAEWFTSAADFIQGFADGCHHRKEEGVLFPAMETAGVPRERGPIGVMLAEHEQGRRWTRAMRAAADKMATGDTGARADVQKNAVGYVTLLRQHIQKENTILFPMADRVIQGAQQAEVAEAFERVEREETGAGLHEKYLGVADALERALES
jgi:hemerythrin-like domain-containing protein